MQKSPIDDLFFTIFGYYPKKAGEAYEKLVACSFKILTGQNLYYNQHLKGVFSKTDYQIDALNKDENAIIEAKDYSIGNRKVGRSDLQKLQGALSDLNIKKGIFASATEYTKPAQRYADSSEINPLQKDIELYEIRPSTELDEKGRIKTIVIYMTMVTADYKNAKYELAWTEDAINVLKKYDLINKELSFGLDSFYNNDGTFNCLLSEYTFENQPIYKNIDDEFGEGCWLLHGLNVKYKEFFLGLKGIQYKIPFRKSTTTFKIETEGIPKILIKSDDGNTNKLLTDEQFKKLILENGMIK